MTTTTNTRAETLATLTAGQAELRAAIAGLPEERMTVPVAGEWSAANILAHIAAWNDLAARDLGRATQGRVPMLADFRMEELDDWNAALMRGRRLFPPAQALAELEDAWRELRSALEQLPEGMFAENALVQGVCQIGIDHTIEHAAELRQWRQAQGA